MSIQSSDSGTESGITLGQPSRAMPITYKNNRKNNSWNILIGRLVIGFIFFGFWEISSGRLMNSFWISKPSLILARLIKLLGDGKLWFHLSATLQEILLGLAVGMIGGIVLGITLAYSGNFQYWIAPYILGLFSLPKASLAPLFVIWFGIGLTSKMFMVITMVIFVVFYNIYEGIRSVDSNLTDMMRTFRAKPIKWLQWIILPSLTSWIINCLRISIGNATVGAVIAEMIGSNRGLGYYITYTSSTLDTTGTFTGLVIVMIVALGLGQLVGILEKKVIRR